MLERLEPPRRLDSDSESDYEGTSARETSKPTTRPRTPASNQENLEANRSKSDDDDEVMVLDSWDIPPLEGSPSTTSGSSSSDTEENERAIQALIDKVAAKVRAEYLRGKEERKRRKQLEKETRKKKK